MSTTNCEMDIRLGQVLHDQTPFQKYEYVECISYQISCFQMFNVNFGFQTNMHLPHNPSSSLHGLECISLWQFMIAKYISLQTKNAFPLKYFKSTHMP